MNKVPGLIKMSVLLIVNFSVFFIDNFYFLISIFFLVLLGGLLSTNSIVTRVRIILPAALLILFFQLIFNTSIPVDERLFSGIFAAIRLITVSVSVLIFLSFTSLAEIARVFDFLPKTALILMIMTFYFIPGVFKESENIKAVQKSRGLKLKSWNYFTGIASLIIPLLHRIFQRAETLSYTLLSRGYED